MKRYLVWLFPICLTLSHCKSKEADTKTKAKAEELAVIQLAVTDTFLSKKYVTRIQAIRNVDIRNKVEGYLEKIYIDEGQEVKKGQLLFAINTTEFRTAVAQAQARLSNAMAEAKEADVQMKRVQLLVEKDVISKTELDLAKATYNSRQARIAEARSVLNNANTLLSYTYIRAPFDGIINRIPMKVGSLLPKGSLLTTVSDVSSVYAYFNIAEDEYLKYVREREVNADSQASAVALYLADGVRYNYPGKIETSSSEFDLGTGALAFRAKFPNPKKMLRHGASGEVELRTKASNVLLLPQVSAFEIQDRHYVYVVDSTNKVKMKSFIPSSRIANFYVVKEGLLPGDRIVYEGTQNLKEGTLIKPAPKNLSELLRGKEEDNVALAQVLD